jgi:hypothetical protein
MSSPRQFSCAKSDASSCPSTPSPTSTTSISSRAKEEAYYSLITEIANLHAEIEALREQHDYYHQHDEEQRVQQQSHNQWIAENLEEAQRIIDNIVGIKGITEDPLKAAIELGISSHTATTADRKQQQPQQQRKILEERIMSRLTTRREHDFIAMCDDQGSMPFECGR